MPTIIRPLPPLSEKDIARFNSKVYRRGPDECWPWLKCLAKGYGSFTVAEGGKRRNIQAPRVAQFLATGVDPLGQLVCHTCDSRYPISDKTYRRCCNPAHFFLGTYADNNADCAKKGRTAKGDRNGTRVHPDKRCHGETHGMVKLSTAQVIEIRRRFALGGVLQYQLAEEFSVSKMTISEIILWKKRVRG